MPLSPVQLADLIGAHPSPDEFGPGSERPALVFRLDNSDARLGAALEGLPCPIIGIGQGALADICDVVLPDEAHLRQLMNNIMAAPFAAMVLVQHLRASASQPVKAALSAESMAYATLQFGPEFRAWRASVQIDNGIAEEGPALLIDRQPRELLLTMNRPRSRNAIGVEMRDALCEAFDLARLDAEIGKVVLKGAGRCFSVGGDLAEFGTSSDPATAHWVRSVRLPAQRVVSIADRLEVRTQGAVIGAGIEIAAFARRVVASPDAWFQLPEIKYGLIPGAGGTVSIPRRIGRQRAAEMMLSARRISAATALNWGLIDAIE